MYVHSGNGHEARRVMLLTKITYACEPISMIQPIHSLFGVLIPPYKVKGKHKSWRTTASRSRISLMMTNIF